jgi:hypothetical protein
MKKNTDTTRKIIVSHGATRSERSGQQSTSLHDSRRNKGGGLSHTTSRETHRSYPTIQQCIADLELCSVPETSQDVRDQREATSRSTVERIKYLVMECKQLTNCNS